MCHVQLAIKLKFVIQCDNMSKMEFTFEEVAIKLGMLEMILVCFDVLRSLIFGSSTST